MPFLYQPTPLEEAYGLYLLETFFQITTDHRTNFRISGRLAVPFLTKSHVNRLILRNIWSAVDPHNVGVMETHQQFYTSLRLISLAQSGILQQCLADAFHSGQPQTTPTVAMQVCLRATQGDRLELPQFDGIQVPDSAFLQHYLHQQHQRKVGGSIEMDTTSHTSNTSTTPAPSPSRESNNKNYHHAHSRSDPFDAFPGTSSTSTYHSITTNTTPRHAYSLSDPFGGGSGGGVPFPLLSPSLSASGGGGGAGVISSASGTAPHLGGGEGTSSLNNNMPASSSSDDPFAVIATSSHSRAASTSLDPFAGATATTPTTTTPATIDPFGYSMPAATTTSFGTSTQVGYADSSPVLLTSSSTNTSMSISDAFGGLVEVHDQPLPTLTTTTVEAEAVIHTTTSSSSNHHQSTTTVGAYPPALVSSTSDEFGDFEATTTTPIAVTQQQPPIGATTTFHDSFGGFCGSSAISPVVSPGINGGGGGVGGFGDTGSTTSAAAVVHLPDDDFGDFCGSSEEAFPTTTATATALAPSSFGVDLSAVSGFAPEATYVSSGDWDALDALVGGIQDAPLPSLAPVAVDDVAVAFAVDEEPKQPQGDDDDFGDFTATTTTTASSANKPEAIATTNKEDDFGGFTSTTPAGDGLESTSLFDSTATTSGLSSLSDADLSSKPKYSQFPVGETISSSAIPEDVDDEFGDFSATTTAAANHTAEAVTAASESVMVSSSNGYSAEAKSIPTFSLFPEPPSGGSLVSGLNNEVSDVADEKQQSPEMFVGIDTLSFDVQAFTSAPAQVQGLSALDAFGELENAPLPSLSQFGAAEATTSATSTATSQVDTAEAVVTADAVPDAITEEPDGFGDFVGMEETTDDIVLGDVLRVSAEVKSIGGTGALVHEDESDGFGDFVGTDEAVEARSDLATIITITTGMEEGERPTIAPRELSKSWEGTNASLSEALSHVRRSSAPIPITSGWDALDALADDVGKDAPFPGPAAGSTDAAEGGVSTVGFGGDSSNMMFSASASVPTSSSFEAFDGLPGTNLDAPLPPLSKGDEPKHVDRAFATFANGGTVVSSANENGAAIFSSSNPVVSEDLLQAPEALVTSERHVTSASDGVVKSEVKREFFKSDNRVDSAYYSANDSTSDDLDGFESAVETDNEDQPSVILDSEQTNSGFPQSGEYGVSSTCAASESDDPFAVFNRPDAPPPELPPLSAFGAQNASSLVDFAPPSCQNDVFRDFYPGRDTEHKVDIDEFTGFQGYPSQECFGTDGREPSGTKPGALIAPNSVESAVIRNETFKEDLDNLVTNPPVLPSVSDTETFGDFESPECDVPAVYGGVSSAIGTGQGMAQDHGITVAKASDPLSANGDFAVEMSESDTFGDFESAEFDVAAVSGDLTVAKSTEGGLAAAEVISDNTFGYFAHGFADDQFTAAEVSVDTHPIPVPPSSAFEINDKASFPPDSLSPVSSHLTPDVSAPLDQSDSDWDAFQGAEEYPATSTLNAVMTTELKAEKEKLLLVRKLVVDTTMRLPEAIRRQKDGDHVDFGDCFDANIGIDVPVSEERKRRTQLCIQLTAQLTTSQSKLASTYWEQAFAVTRNELTTGLSILEEARRLPPSELTVCRTKLEVYVHGLGEYVRVTRAVVGTIGDLLMLDTSALFTVDTLASSWCNISFLEVALEIDNLWKEVEKHSLQLRLTNKQETAHKLDTVEEIRRSSSLLNRDLHLCQFTLQPLTQAQESPTKSPAQWKSHTYMACTANFLQSKCPFYTFNSV